MRKINCFQGAIMGFLEDKGGVGLPLYRDIDAWFEPPHA
jgi:hypothetical protein